MTTLTAPESGARVVTRPGRLAGEIRVPGDKSISHRAILHNLIAEGTAHIENLGPGDDIRSSLGCARALGAEIQELSARACLIRAPGPGRLREPEDVLDAGNSGTTVRLLAGILAAQPFFTTVTGDRSLRSRPMERIISPLRAMGAAAYARGNDEYLPLAIRGGNLHGIEYALPAASAQVKSCLLLAGAMAQGITLLHEPAASRDHTERLLRAQGATITVDGLHITVEGGHPLSAIDVAVPGDTSSAAFWVVAGCLHSNAEITVRGVGLTEGRTGLFDVLNQMGADVTVSERRIEGGEQIGDVTARSSKLHGVTIGGDLIPRLIDEVPVLAVAAACAEGSTVIRDAQELRYKESDRIAAVAAELGRLGVEIEERPDGMAIHGRHRIPGGTADSHDDHRMAMALAVAGLLSESPVTVLGSQCVTVSYPGFWDDLARLAGG